MRSEDAGGGRMTREEAIRIIKIVLFVAEDFEIIVQGEEFTKEKCKEAVEIVTKALEQEPCTDAISRQAVDDAIYEYSRSCDVNYAQIMEFIEKIPPATPQPCKVSEYDKDHIWYKGSQYISLRRFLEVKAETKQEPCDDAISRQAVLDLPRIKTHNHWGNVIKESVDIEDVRQLPPVTPTEKVGKWKRISMDKYSEHAKYWYRCDRCGEDNLGNTNYCPNCGQRKMQEVEE
jgi:hypothetical protein